jgi:hypothetical protein
MKNSSIADRVFAVNLNYVKLQNKTKELFFRCLDENRDFEYFKAELEKIWGNVDYSYLEEQIAEYQAEIHKKNTHQEKTKKGITKGLFALVPLLVIMNTDKKFQNVKLREYTISLKSYAYKSDKQEYLKLKVKKYNNQIVPYYSQTTGELVRYVQPSTYDAMIQNTNLTRSGWNQTLSDGDEMGQAMFYIPGHSFSCPHCLEHQNKPMTREDVEDFIGKSDETSGDILHPNCKCELSFYNKGTKIKKYKYSDSELEEQYQIRQKANTLTLRKEEILSDMRIQKSLGNQDEVDKLNQTRNRINKEIRELKEQLPNAELKKQVVAINR